MCIIERQVYFFRRSAGILACKKVTKTITCHKFSLHNVSAESLVKRGLSPLAICVLNNMAVFSRMRGNRILERLTVQDCNTPHSCDYRYKSLV